MAPTPVLHRYRHGNKTRWANYAFALDVALHEGLLASPHSTYNPHDADFFFVPVYGGCFISRFTRPTPRHNLYVTRVRSEAAGAWAVAIVHFTVRPYDLRFVSSLDESTGGAHRWSCVSRAVCPWRLSRHMDHHIKAVPSSSAMRMTRPHSFPTSCSIQLAPRS